MRRADRLFQIIQILRAGRLVTAQELARRLEVSERTLYRDMQELMAQGVPVEGAAGVGYLLRAGELDIPPLMFSRDELEALVVGARMVGAWGGERLARSAERALEKIEAVVPDDARRRILTDSRLFAPGFTVPEGQQAMLDRLRDAINERAVVRLDYQRLDGQPSTREAWPLGLHYWGRVWTLAAWCRLRDEFRSFRVDRIQAATATGESYPDQPGRRLSDYVAKMQAEARTAP